jgi:hypothetical protein
VIPIAVGGFFMFFYLRQLASEPVLAIGDPKLEMPENPETKRVQAQERSAS